jgi:hydrogenase expression/formation protein HypE
MGEETVTMAHGSGGAAYHELVEQVFVPAFANDMLAPLGDAAICGLAGGRLAFTTDSFVVQPRFFPGGDIGRLAVCGTVNDLAMSGASPLYLSCGLILQAGLPLDELKRVVASMAEAAREAGVSIVTGDTKVVEQGGCDGIYINTAGIGRFKREPLGVSPRPGDIIVVSGPLARHGLAVLAARQVLDFDPPIVSDAAPLHELAEILLTAAPHTSCMRDPTRGGLAATLYEWAAAARLTITLEEAALPLSKPVRAACDILGLDALYVANEGVFAAALPPEEAAAALAALRAHPLGAQAAIIGRAGQAVEHIPLIMRTAAGGERRVDLPHGELLPRIC